MTKRYISESSNKLDLCVGQCSKMHLIDVALYLKLKLVLACRHRHAIRHVFNRA